MKTYENHISYKWANALVPPTPFQGWRKDGVHRRLGLAERHGGPWRAMEGHGGPWKETAGFKALTTNACGQSAWSKLPRDILGI